MPQVMETPTRASKMMSAHAWISENAHPIFYSPSSARSRKNAPPERKQKVRAAASLGKYSYKFSGTRDPQPRPTDDLDGSLSYPERLIPVERVRNAPHPELHRVARFQ